MPSATSNNASADRRTRLRIAAALGVTFCVVYQLTLVGDLPVWPQPALSDVPPAKSLRIDTLFDSDTPHIMSDAIYGQTHYKVPKHPLFLLYSRGPSALLNWLGLSPVRAVLTVTSAWAALAVAVSFVVFLRLGLPVLAALAGSVVFGFSPAVWLLASVPETFGYNVLSVVLAFLLVDPRLAQPRQHHWRFLAFAFYAVFAIGATLPNAVYVGASFLTSLLLAKARPLAFVTATAAMAAAVAILGALFLGAQAIAHPQANAALSINPADHLKPRYIRMDRGWQPSWLAIELRTFLADAWIGRTPELQLQRTTRGKVELIQFASGDLVYRATLGAVLLFLVAAALARRRSRSAPACAETKWPAWLALGLLSFNLVFHYYYRSHGQPLIYASHTVFPLLVLCGLLVRPALALASVRTLGTLAFLLLIANNALSVDKVQDLLHRPCERWRLASVWSGPKHPLCLRWGAMPGEKVRASSTAN